MVNKLSITLALQMGHKVNKDGLWLCNSAKTRYIYKDNKQHQVQIYSDNDSRARYMKFYWPTGV